MRSAAFVPLGPLSRGGFVPMVFLMGPFDILTQQHRQLEEQLEAFESEEGPRGPEARREQLEALAALLRGHVWLEENHLFPVLARVEGRARARQEAEEHLAMRELVEELEELEPETDEWWARLTALEDLLVAHARAEELEIFPRLSATLDARQQEALHRGLLGLREQLLARTSLLSDSEPSLPEPRGDA